MAELERKLQPISLEATVARLANRVQALENQIRRRGNAELIVLRGRWKLINPNWDQATGEAPEHTYPDTTWFVSLGLVPPNALFLDLQMIRQTVEPAWSLLGEGTPKSVAMSPQIYERDHGFDRPHASWSFNSLEDQFIVAPPLVLPEARRARSQPEMIHWRMVQHDASNTIKLGEGTRQIYWDIRVLYVDYGRRIPTPKLIDTGVN